MRSTEQQKSDFAQMIFKSSINRLELRIAFAKGFDEIREIPRLKDELRALKEKGA